MKKIAAIAAVGLLSLVSACASSGNSAGSAGTGAKTGTIGILQLNAQSEVISHWADTLTNALHKVGWKTVVIDGKADPQVLGQGMTSLLTQQVDGIITLTVDSTLIAQPLRMAVDQHVPVVAAGTTVSDDAKLFSAVFAPEDAGFATALVDYVSKRFPSGTQFVQIDVPAIFAAHQLIVETDPLLEKAGYERVASGDMQPVDIITQTANTTQTLVTAHPGVGFILSCCDFMPPIIAPVLQQTGHSDVLILSRYDNPSTLDLIRHGSNAAVVAVNADTSVLRAAEALMAHYTTGTTIPTDNDQSAYKYTVVDKANVPAEGKTFYGSGQQISDFVAHWKNGK